MFGKAQQRTEDLKSYKRKSIAIAKELYFPQDVLQRLQTASERRQIENLMIEGRRRL